MIVEQSSYPQNGNTKKRSAASDSATIRMRCHQRRLAAHHSNRRRISSLEIAPSARTRARERSINLMNSGLVLRATISMSAFSICTSAATGCPWLVTRTETLPMLPLSLFGQRQLAHFQGKACRSSSPSRQATPQNPQLPWQLEIWRDFADGRRHLVEGKAAHRMCVARRFQTSVPDGMYRVVGRS